MKKQLYITPQIQITQMETANIIATSSQPGVSDKPADPNGDVLSNQNMWSDGVW